MTTIESATREHGLEMPESEKKARDMIRRFESFARAETPHFFAYFSYKIDDELHTAFLKGLSDKPEWMSEDTIKFVVGDVDLWGRTLVCDDGSVSGFWYEAAHQGERLLHVDISQFTVAD